MEIVHQLGYNGNLPHSLSLFNNFTCHISGGTLIHTDLTTGEQNFFRGHDQDITAFDLSPSGTFAATACGGYNSDICIWDISSKSLVYRLSEHDHKVSSVCFSNDGRFLVSVGGHHSVPDGFFIVWDTLSGGMVAYGYIEHSTCHDVAWGERVLDIKGRETDVFQFAIASEAGIRLVSFDPQSGSIVNVIKPSLGSYARQFLTLSFSQDKSFLFAGTSSGDVCVLNLRNQSFNLFAVIPVTSGGILSLISTRFGFIAGGGAGNLIGIEFNKDARQNSIKILDQKFESGITSLSLSATSLLVGCNSGSIFITSLSNPSNTGVITSSIVNKLENHNGHVSSVVFNSEDQITTLSDDGTFRRWNTTNYKCLSTGFVKSSTCGSSLSLASGKILSFCGFQDGIVRCFDTERGGDVLWSISTCQSPVNSIFLSSSERMFCTGTGDGAVRLWDVRRQSLLTLIKNHRQSINDVALFGNDRFVVSVGSDSMVLVSDVESQAKITGFKCSGPATSCHVSRDQKSIFVTSTDGSIINYDLSAGSVVQSIQLPDKPEALCIDGDAFNRYVAVGSSDSFSHLFDVRNLSTVASVLGHSSCVRDLKFSPSGSQLASVGNDCAVTLWSIA
ncbi:hypothetical protein RCL1_008564 [Eukaryota sp. TZLM3-RCL]